MGNQFLIQNHIPDITINPKSSFKPNFRVYKMKQSNICDMLMKNSITLGKRFDGQEGRNQRVL
jgi:hypothetical protein